jgi:hypothetical protein
METALWEARCIKPNQLWDREGDENDANDVWDVLDADFTAYCVVSALMPLRRWPREISQHDKLTALAIDLLNPNEPHFDILKVAVSRIEISTHIFSQKDWWEMSHFGTSHKN